MRFSQSRGREILRQLRRRNSARQRLFSVRACQRSGHRFCVECGSALYGAPTAASDAQTAAAPAVARPSLPSLRLQWWGRLSRLGKTLLILAVLAVIGIAAFALLGDGLSGGAQTQNEEDAPAQVESPSIKSAAAPRFEPNPDELDIRANPTQHHRLEMIFDGSALIIGGDWPSNILLHNNTDLIGQDVCKDYNPDPEGRSSILLIKPQDNNEEWRPFFFVAGCTEGDATLEIIIDGESVSSYAISVGAP